MELRIITNNKTVKSKLEEMGERPEFLEGHALDIVKHCKVLAEEGWILSVDPLAGYYSRPNPYHTIFMQSGKRGTCKVADLKRLDKTANQWELYYHVIPMTPDLEKGYIELDYELAINTYISLKKTPEFYNCI